MKLKKWIVLALAVCLVLSLVGCGGGPTVYVQSVSGLMGLGGIAPGDRFAGMVVSEHVAEIQKDEGKTIAETLVKEGDDVKEGDILFSYDTEQLQLTLDKQRLELEQLQATVENLTEQIAQLEKERNRVGGSDKLQYTVQIQTNQVDLKEAELNIKTKETEVEKSEQLLENADVVSPVNGRVQSIHEEGTDQNGNPLPFITIQKSGAYRIKGTLGELQRGGITEGSRLKILSRTDDSLSWMGTVTLVDYENPIQGSDNGMMMGGDRGDEMTTASKYPFYVELDSTDGLLLGQHVYMELDSGDGEGFAVSVPGAFLIREESGTNYVWAETGKGKLEKRGVVLGAYDEMTDTYEITAGLSPEDYIAFPDPEICREGAITTHNVEDLTVEEDEDGMMEPGMDEGGVMDDGLAEEEFAEEFPEEEFVEEAPMEEVPAEEAPAQEASAAETGEGGA